MIPPMLSEGAIRAHAGAESYSRGASYYQRGAVGDLILRGNTLQADVQGSQYTPYRVRVTFDQEGVSTADCTCPYDWGGWCKHIVAALLKCLRDPATIEARPPLATLLADLDRPQLQVLLVELADHDLDLAGEIERRVSLMRLASVVPQSPQAAGPAHSSKIDQEAIRQQVRLALRPARRARYDDYDYDDEEDPSAEVVEIVRPLLEQARRFGESGDARGALAVLEALTAAYIDGAGELLERLEEQFGITEGAATDFFDDLSEAWAEMILDPDLSEDEREEWGEKIAGWRDNAEDLGAGEAFDLALAAAEQGWEYPPLRRVLQGEIGERGAWEREAPDYADTLALVRLRILERQARLQEYLYLAEAEGQIERYVAMLAKLGRTQEAVEEGIAHLTAAGQFRELAGILRERGELDSALRLAEHGAALTPPREAIGSYAFYGDHQRAELASWAADLAAQMGDQARALRAAETAFRITPSLRAYLKAQELAGERWEAVRPALLEGLRQSHAADAKVDIFLREGLIDDAIASVKGSHSYGLLEQVVDAATATRPDWVIRTATTQAERIMDAGQAQQYDHAVNWLRHAREAFRIAGRDSDWRSYLADVRAKHGRKHKLMGLIERM
jgi:uncharacterized Zn finger protein